MIRDILFRGKSKINAEEMNMYGIPHENGWVNGFYLDGYICGKVVDVDSDYIAPEWWCKVDPATVGQYTGRTAQCTDKIYEGDICIVTVFDHNGCDTQYKCTVDWYEGGFIFISTPGERDFVISLCDIDDTDSDVEFIGNIHDNPELLEGE